LKGQNQGQLAWAFEADAGALADAKGKVVPAGAWPHDVTAHVDPKLVDALAPLLGDQAQALPKDVAVTASWTGERTATGIAGTLTLPKDAVHVGPYAADGRARISVEGNTIAVQPDDLSLHAPAVPTVTLAGGKVSLVGMLAQVDDLRVRFADGTLRASGQADLDQQKGSLNASWEQIAFPAGVQSQGTLAIDAANIWPGKPQVNARLTLTGHAAGGVFETHLNALTTGNRWTDATTTINVPMIRASRKTQIKIENARFVLHNTASAVQLVEAGIESTGSGATPTLKARAELTFAGQHAGDWFFTAVGSGFPIAQSRALGFNVDAVGNHEQITLKTAYASIGRSIWANLTGQYVYGRPEPVGMQLVLDSDPHLSLKLNDRLNAAGHVSGALVIGGTVQPMNVTIRGHVKSQNFAFDDLAVGDADIAVQGKLSPDKAELHTQRLNLFGGEGSFEADFPYFDREIHASLDLKDMRLSRIGEAVNVTNLAGLLGGTVDLRVPIDNPLGMVAGGQLNIDHPVGPMLNARRVIVPIGIQDGWINLSPEATQDTGGTAALNLYTTFAALTKVNVQAKLSNWQTALPLQDMTGLTDADVVLNVDVQKQSAMGSVKVDQQVSLGNQTIGQAAVDISANGRSLALNSVTGQILDGVAYGQGTLNLDALDRAELWTGITGMSFNKLARLAPQLGDVKGKLSLRIHAHPADVAHPLGPVQVDLNVDSDHATYKGIQIGDTRIKAFAATDRIVLADDPKDPNQIAIAGGTANLWARLSRVPAGAQGTRAQPSAFVSIQLDRLDTEQLNRMIDPDGKPVPGRLSGTISAYGNPFAVRRLNGDGMLNITDSDLANIGVFAVLYNAMHLGMGPNVPNGEGEIAFRLDNGRLDVTRLNYFNRGVFAKGVITVDNVLRLKESPLSGYLLGTFRPLKDTALPFLGTLDGILDALQRNATTLKIGGTVKQVQAVPVTLHDVSSDLRNLIVGEAQAK
ncbi:MAG: hypothetical protein ACTHLN_01515, partial [Tepidisphaeraceae bacterium]